MTATSRIAETTGILAKRKDVIALAQQVVGLFPSHCAGSPFLPSAAYVAAPLIGVGIAPVTDAPLLDRIVAFDRAESSAANITQTNLIQVSSFCGPRGLLLGHDILTQPVEPHPLLPDAVDDRDNIKVCNAEPLFAATLALFGTIDNPRFPILPGQHVLCAYKTLYREGPCTLYGALAVAIPEDRSRDADLFLEDHGGLDSTESLDTREGQEAARLLRLVDAVRQIGQNLAVRYDKVFVGVRRLDVPEGHVGCVLTAAPYIHLAMDAIPGGFAETIAAITLAQWQEAVAHRFS